MDVTKGNYGLRHLYKTRLTDDFCVCGEAVDSPLHMGTEIYIPFKELSDAATKFYKEELDRRIKVMEGQFDKLEGKKHDGGKPPMALLSGAALTEVAKVLEFGAKKYDSWNWKGGFAWSRLASAVLRHIFSWLSGEDKDPETGLSHLAHAACGLVFLLDFEVNKIGNDDRYKK